MTALGKLIVAVARGPADTPDRRYERSVACSRRAYLVVGIGSFHAAPAARTHSLRFERAPIDRDLRINSFIAAIDRINHAIGHAGIVKRGIDGHPRISPAASEHRVAEILLLAHRSRCAGLRIVDNVEYLVDWSAICTDESRQTVQMVGVRMGGEHDVDHTARTGRHEIAQVGVELLGAVAAAILAACVDDRNAARKLEDGAAALPHIDEMHEHLDSRGRVGTGRLGRSHSNGPSFAHKAGSAVSETNFPPSRMVGDEGERFAWP